MKTGSLPISIYIQPFESKRNTRKKEWVGTQKIIKDNNFELIHEVHEQPWKQKAFRFYDFDKNIIEIGERMEHVAFRLSAQGLSTDEICKITYLPIDIVQKSIDEYSS